MPILDTSILIDFMNGSQKARKALQSLSGNKMVAIFTKYELLRGETESNSVVMHGLLDSFEVCDYTNEALMESIRIYNNLKAKGKIVNEIDILIAAIAIARNEELLATDHHFKEINSTLIKVI
jgi:predicted nucleic acid-binding protein